MKHPSEATLALFAAGDLGSLGRWRTERHVAGCRWCRMVTEEFQQLRRNVGDLCELPGLTWGRLAAEMKANIRLGLEAGECVRDDPSPAIPRSLSFPGWRALAACGAMVALVVVGILLEHPAPAPATRADGIVLRATRNGIELDEDGQVLTLLHRRAREQAQEVTYTAGAQGSIAARYVDPDAGYVTVNKVYGQ
jgi:hypothetical protein